MNSLTFDKNSEIIKEFIEKTQKVRQKAIEKVLNPLEKLLKQTLFKEERLFEQEEKFLQLDKSKIQWISLKIFCFSF